MVPRNSAKGNKAKKPGLSQAESFAPPTLTSAIQKQVDALTQREESEESSNDGISERTSSSSDGEDCADADLGSSNEGSQGSIADNEDGNVNNDSENESSEETPITLPAKRTKRAGKKGKSVYSGPSYIFLAEYSPERICRDVQVSDNDATDAAPAEPVSIIYNLLFFSAEELNKPVCCRQPKAGYIVLKDNIPWDNFFGQLKVKACDALFPTQPVVDTTAFEVFFQISRHVPNPLPLTSAADYAHLLTNASRMHCNPAVKVIFNSWAPNLVRESQWCIYLTKSLWYPRKQTRTQN